MWGTAAAASSRSTVRRTSSEPARASAAIWRVVAFDVGGVGVGHRLHDDRRAAANGHRPVAVADPNPDGRVAGKRPAGRFRHRKAHRRHTFPAALRPKSIPQGSKRPAQICHPRRLQCNESLESFTAMQYDRSHADGLAARSDQEKRRCRSPNATPSSPARQAASAWRSPAPSPRKGRMSSSTGSATRRRSRPSAPKSRRSSGSRLSTIAPTWPTAPRSRRWSPTPGSQDGIGRHPRQQRRHPACLAD